MSHAIALPIWKRRYLLLILTLLYLGGTNGWLVYKGQWNAFTTQVFLANNTLGARSCSATWASPPGTIRTT